MGVRSTDTEGADSGATGLATASLDPGCERRVYEKGTVSEVDLGIRILVVKTWRDCRILQL